MKCLALMIMACAITYGSTNDVTDILMDAWLSHAHDMMVATKNQESSSKGIQFLTKCGAFLTWENCTVEADLGIVKDLSSLKRHSSVGLTDLNDATATVRVDLAYDDLGVFYPNMLIYGQGIRMEYKGISLKPKQPLPFTLDMVLDYSKGVENCSNNFKLTPPSIMPNFTATVESPKDNLPISDLNDLAKQFLSEVGDHITTLINYEKVCQRLVHLF